MTIEEAILQMAIVELKKQTTKKPIKIKKSYWIDYMCPNCGELLGNTIKVDRSSLCPCCRQALNW